MLSSVSAHRGIFGGTFDPIHLGHTGSVRQVVKLAGLDEVRVIPVSVPPHREQPVASAAQRLDMVRIALAEESAMVADGRELDRPGRSYTVETVNELRTEFPGSRLSIILGLDAALELDKWHRWRDLLDMVAVIVMVRPGWTLPNPLPPWWDEDTDGAPAETSAGKITRVSISPLDISATRIRSSLRTGETVADQLHPGVLDYIQRHRIYSN